MHGGGSQGELEQGLACGMGKPPLQRYAAEEKLEKLLLTQWVCEEQGEEHLSSHPGYATAGVFIGATLIIMINSSNEQ